MHFGPINYDGGERRLNVAITRARRLMHVVSAFTHEDMVPNWPKHGPAMLRRFLEQAATERASHDLGRAVGAPLNDAERDVWQALDKRSIPVTPQWGVSGYRIDFALGDPERPGRMVLAVELDGNRHHQLGSARDRDRLRQAHLERMGWTFHRVWASAWFADPNGEADRIEQHWRQAIATPASTIRVASNSALEPGPEPRRRGALPVQAGLRIDQYTDDELEHVVRWVLSDGLPLDRGTRVRHMWEALGFKRAGSRIVTRCNAALNRVHADGEV
jgi:very-short-patch-repair endonuclease